jgi:hypothetical protein
VLVELLEAYGHGDIGALEKSIARTTPKVVSIRDVSKTHREAGRAS